MANKPDTNQKVQLVIVVNGEPTNIEANVHAPLRTVVAHALSQSGNVGQPPENWELRNEAGSLLELDRKIEAFGFVDGTRLFLNLKAGVGG